MRMTDLPAKVVLLHTNDIHSSFHAMPGVAGTIARLRGKHAASPVILADCGDHMDRMSFITEAGGGEAHLGIWEASGYDYIALGNNEGLTFTKKRLNELFARKADFSVLTANLRDKDTGLAPSWMHASRIWEYQGLRIGIIGVTAPYPIFYNLLGWHIDDPYEAVQREVNRLRRGVHAIVVLSHLGLRSDKKLAEVIEGIDVIVGGHTHHVLETPLEHSGSLLLGCGSMGRYVGEVELYFDTTTGRLLQVEGRIHPTENETEDLSVKQLVARCAHESREAMQETVAVLERPLEVDWERDSPLGNLLAAGIRKQTGAPIGIINSGQLLTSLLAGRVTKETLLAMCPSPINMCVIRLSGRALQQALEQSLLEEFVHMPLYGNGFRGKHLGGLCVDGLTVYWNPEGEPYRKISSILVDGRELDWDLEYEVGTGDMFTFGTGYLSLKEGKEPRYFLPRFLRHVLEVELNDPGAVEACRASRFHFGV
jgi:5'-nucleotidase